MNYRYDRKKKIRNNGYLVGTILLIVVFVTPLPQRIFDILERPLAAAWENAQANEVELTGFFHQFYAKGKLLEQQDELQQRITQLEIDALRTRYLESVLTSYQLIEESNPQALVAEVIARSPKTPSGTVVLNMGSRYGVVPGSEVITYDNVSLGVIAEVYDTTSVVDLYTKAEITTQAVLYPHARSFTLIGHGGRYRAELARDIEVAEGDIAYSQYVPGRILGIVQKVIFDPRDPFKQVYFSLPLEPSSIQSVGIVPATNQPLPIEEKTTEEPIEA